MASENLAKQTNNNAKTLEQISGSEALLKCLIAEGVTTIFGYPGGAIMPIYDALYDYQDQLQHILVRHEQGAIHAAQGYARVSDKVGVCFATSGPGATNLVTGLTDALADSTPIVCITGQVAAHLLGTDAFQETDVVGITSGVTKWNCIVTKTTDIPAAIAKAFYVARSGRPGPVLIDITKNAQFEIFDYEYQSCEKLPSYYPKPAANLDLLQQAAKLLNNAQAPYMLIGQGILLSGAQKELQEFAEKTGIPVASTLLGLSAMNPDHPQYVGYLGMHGNYAPNKLTNQCDVLLAVGMRFDDRVTGSVATYAKQAKVIHIDIDPSELNKLIKTEVAIHADAKEALNILNDLVIPKKYPEWMARFKAFDLEEKTIVIDDAINPKGDTLRMAQVVHQLSEMTEGKAIIVTDVGQHQMITSRYYRYHQTQSNVTSGGLGTMGFALPAAMGAKLAQPDREVIAIIGDGGFQMTMQELATIFQYKIPVKVIILNNNFLGMVRQWQQLFFDKRYSFTEMVNPDFVALAKAFYIQAKKIEHKNELQDGLSFLLDSKDACLLEVVVEKEDNVFPMIPTGAAVDEVRLA